MQVLKHRHVIGRSRERAREREKRGRDWGRERWVDIGREDGTDSLLQDRQEESHARLPCLSWYVMKKLPVYFTSTRVQWAWRRPVGVPRDPLLCDEGQAELSSAAVQYQMLTTRREEGREGRKVAQEILCMEEESRAWASSHPTLCQREWRHRYEYCIDTVCSVSMQVSRTYIAELKC